MPASPRPRDTNTWWAGPRTRPARYLSPYCDGTRGAGQGGRGRQPSSAVRLFDRGTPMSRATQPRLPLLLSEIHACRLCPSVVPSEVPRSVISTWCTDLVLMAQAPSKQGVRLSGVHWVDAQGKLRPPGGTYLECYLRSLGYSIDPAEPRLPRPYTTNVLQCWPGPGKPSIRGKERDRPPSRAEVENCSRWWQTELKLLRPKAVVLLGKPAADAVISACRLEDDFASLLEDQGRVVPFANCSVHVFTVPHPTSSYSGPRGGRSEYYDFAFSALRSHLRVRPSQRGACCGRAGTDDCRGGNSRL
jgi:uracil-DNA glycosylase family 4